MPRNRRRTPSTRAMRRPAILLERIGNMLDILACGTPKERAEVVTDLQKDNRLALMEARNRQIRGDEDGTK